MGAPLTPDGRYIVVRGRLWRAANPALSEPERARLTTALMAARRQVAAARRRGSAPDLAAARAAVDAAGSPRPPVAYYPGSRGGRAMPRRPDGSDTTRHVMRTSRLEAFSDGVLAIIITIMVLELEVPHATEWSALGPLWPVILSYVLSFVYIGLYWNNHHHMFHLTHRVTGGILWANLHLLFWLSLVPFTTAWMGENHFAPVPTAAYGVVLLCAAIAYYGLQQLIVRSQGRGSELAAAVGRDWKGKVSPLIYVTAILAAVLGHPAVAGALYAATALVWLVPDRRIERVLERQEREREAAASAAERLTSAEPPPGLESVLDPAGERRAGKA